MDYFASRLIAKVLGKQPHWPREVKDVLSEVRSDDKTLAQKLNFTEELEKRRPRPTFYNNDKQLKY